MTFSDLLRRVRSFRIGRVLATVPWWAGAVPAVALAAGIGPGCTCANWEYTRAYEAYRHEAVSSYRHEGSQTDVRADLVVSLRDDGYSIEGASNETQWRPSGPESRERVRFEIEGSEPVTVRMFSKSQILSPQRWSRGERERAISVERAVFERLVPEGRTTDEALSDFAYDEPADRLWTEVQAVLAERGFYFTSHPAGYDAVLVTEWLQRDDGAHRERYEAQLDRQEHHQYTLAVHHVVETSVGERTWVDQVERRRIDLEHELIAHRRPADADEIERIAREKGQQAYDAAVERGAPSCGMH